jgi:outer membrane protein assembly factor BamD
MRSYIIVLAGLAVISSSMVSDAEWKSHRKRRYDCSKDLTRACEKYAKGRYNEVKVLLSETKYQCTGHSAMDSILYFLGMSSMLAKSSEEASTEFNRLVIDFPNSPFAEEARFRMGHCSFLASHPSHRDQANTREAIRELSGFVEEYPESRFADSAKTYIEKCRDRLAQKEFETGKFYQKAEKYESAVVYYRSLGVDYPQSKYVPESRISTAYCLAKLQRTGEARQALQQLLDEKPEEQIALKARNTLDRLEIIANEKPGFLFFRSRTVKEKDTLKTPEKPAEIPPAQKTESVEPESIKTETPPAEQTDIAAPDSAKTETQPEPQDTLKQ